MTLKIGIISDTHDNVLNIYKAVKLFNKENISIMIHCGDIVAPGTVQFFEDLKAEKIIFVKGNCDGDISNTRLIVENIGGKFYPDKLELTIKDKIIGIIHGDNYPELEGMINSNKYDYIFHGHTHKIRDEIIGKTRVINPGAQYFHSEEKVAILDIDSNKLRFIKLK